MAPNDLVAIEFPIEVDESKSGGTLQQIRMGETDFLLILLEGIFLFRIVIENSFLLVLLIET